MDRNIIKILLEDQLYDKKSLIFENGIIREIYDEYDSDKIIEGRLGEFEVKRIKGKMGVFISIPLTRTNKDIIETKDIVDEDNLFQLRTPTRFLSLKKMSYSESVTEIKNIMHNESLLEYPGDKNNEKLKEFVGFINSELYENMLGFECILLQNEGEGYVFKYAGKGNFTDIIMEKNNILKLLCRRLMK